MTRPPFRFTPVTPDLWPVWLGASLVLLLASAQAQVAPAGNTTEDTLGRLIKEYQAQRATIERPLLSAYLSRLASLQDTLENRRDPGAAAVAAEISAVQARLSSVDPSPSPPAESLTPEKPFTAPLEFTAKKSQTSGGATCVGDDNSPVLFSGKDSAAQWKLPTLPAGRYRLLWRIACDVGAGATVRLSIDGQPPRTLEIKPTTPSGDAVVANLGEFTAATPPAWLKVEVLSLPGRPRKVGPSFSLAKFVLIPPGVTMPGL